MNALIGFNALWRNRPAADAPASVVAAWYEAKGRFHESLAAVGGPDATAEMEYAAAAYEHARRLLRRSALAESTEQATTGGDVTVLDSARHTAPAPEALAGVAA
jgi:hypothetical protein